MTLVLLAAGLGSRFGGDKQISNVGPRGQMLMEYTAYDAIAAGFDHIVWILKEEMVETVRRNLGDRIAKVAKVSYAVQDYSSLPDFYTVPTDRVKPFGTVHALLCAGEYIGEDEGFATVNADDYYGPEAFARMAQMLRSLPEQGEAGMVSYRLGNTLSTVGGVTRGLCGTENGTLRNIAETGNITVGADGLPLSGDGRTLDPEVPVSMNFWGFRGSIFAPMRAYFHDFLRGLDADNIKGECLLPVMVGDMLNDGQLTVRVDTTTAHWFGMTYKEDKEEVAAKLSDLHRSGAYPETLF